MERFFNFFMLTGRGSDLIAGIKEYEGVYNFYWQSDEEFEKSIAEMPEELQNYEESKREKVRNNPSEWAYEIAEKFWVVSPEETPLLEKYGWFGLDWDPEWEEAWYWEGYDYPATDVNYERYGYVDERGAYDWDYS
jgi:hypothetical protein